MQDSVDRQQQALEDAATVRFLDQQQAQQVSSAATLPIYMSND